MSDMEIRSQLRTFILENYLFTEDQNALSDTQSFLKAGILDSMGILELIAFLEEELGVMAATVAMVPENLDSIDNLMTFIGNRIPA